MKFDKLVHQPTRLRIVAPLDVNGEMTHRNWLDHYTKR